MNIKLKTDLDIEDIARAVGAGSDKDQVLFLNFMFNEIIRSCEVKHRLDRQLLAIEEGLTTEALECINFFEENKWNIY